MFELGVDIKSVNKVSFSNGRTQYVGDIGIFWRKKNRLYGFTDKICGKIFSLAAWK